MAKELTISNENSKSALATVVHWINEALAGGAVSVAVRRPSRSRDQEKHYHALINEIVRHANRNSTIQTTLEGWKAILVYEFEKEKAGLQ